MKKYTLIFVILISFVIFSHSFKLYSLKNVESKVESDQIVEAQKCNATHFEFYGLKYFLQEPQIKLGFNEMNKNYSNLTQISYNSDNENSYNIYRPIATYTYKNPNVSAKFISDKEIQISGGYVEVNIQFDWSHYVNWSTVHRGKGTVFAVSRQIPYIVYTSNQYIMGIMNMTSPKFDEIKLTSLNTEDQQKDPSTAQEKFVINYMLNNMPQNSLKIILQKKLQYLQQILYRVYSQAFPSTDYQGYYVWWNTCNESDAFFSGFLKQYKLLKTDSNSSNPGVYLSYTNNIKDYPNQICGKTVVQEPSDPSKYGTSQQIISFTFLENVLKQVIQQDKLNTILNRLNWGTKTFKFSAREMSFIFSNITENFASSADVQGQCIPDNKNLKMVKASNTTFNVSISQKCSLSIKQRKIVEFIVNLTVEIEGDVKETYLNFWASSFSSATAYNDSFGFKMQNKVLADLNIRETLNRLYEMRLFGSGLKLGMKRQVPQMAVLDSAILVYDAKK